MLPSWEALQQSWPLFAAMAALWGRLEVAMSRQRDLSMENEREIAELKKTQQTQNAVSQTQAVQLGRIEEAVKGMGKTLDRVADLLARKDKE